MWPGRLQLQLRVDGRLSAGDVGDHHLRRGARLLPRAAGRRPLKTSTLIRSFGAALLFGAAPAFAELTPLADQPLTLPSRLVEPKVSFGVTNATLDVDTSSGSKPANGTGLTASVGLDYGFTDQFQLGLFGTFPLSPQANFGAVTAYGEMQLKPDAVAFRLDVGAQQQSLKSGPPGATESSSLMGMVAGAGVPFRVRLGPKLSFVSGNPGGGGFPAQPFLAAGSTALFGDSLFTDDILTVGNWSSTTQTSIGLALHVPVGVRYQLLPNVALGVRTGYRLAISTLSDTTTGAGQTNVVHFIPLALDASAAFAGRYDAGLSLFMTGAVAGDTSQGYADVRGADLWVRALF